MIGEKCSTPEGFVLRSSLDLSANESARSHVGLCWQEGMPIPAPPGSPAKPPWDEAQMAREMAELAQALTEAPWRRVARTVTCSRPRERRGRASARRSAHRTRHRTRCGSSGSDDEGDSSSSRVALAPLIAGGTGR